MGKRLTQEEFIDRCILGNSKLDYSKTIYKGSGEKVCIICPKHGEFWIKANDFLRSLKCPNCSRNIPTTGEFIERCKKYYPEYDYSQTFYTNKTNKVKVRCIKHDYIWEPMAQNLERGLAMCPLCKKELFSNTFRTSKEDFIKKAQNIHNDKYDYSKVNYVNAHTKVIIVCPKHGDFELEPGNHLKGVGCPKCKRSKGEEIVSNFLLKNNIEFLELYLIPYNDKKIYVDFYIPKLNTFIEYNGKLHYVAMDYFGGSLRLELQKARDLYLREYCVNNNINLIEIKYDQLVVEVLNEKLTERRDNLRHGNIG